MERLERSLQFHFATLTAIGGLMMATGEVGIALPLVAVLAAALSFLLVDLWKILYLPAPAAYIGMGLVAVYCMGNFLGNENGNQLLAVAELLVGVEAVLLFQRKSARVFEQIGTFCLLELIVAAVFNHAMEFGLLLVPFSIVGLRALALLHAFTTVNAAGFGGDGVIRTDATGSARLAASRSRGVPRWVAAAIGPAVLLVAAVFFFALPRVAGAPETNAVGGRATTGFSKSMTLDQVGELLQNEDLVMRLSMQDQRTGEAYRASEPIYLRGEVLERYEDDGGQGVWNAVRLNAYGVDGPLPKAYHPPDEAEQQRYDRVEVRVDAQPLSSQSLFSIAPYHTPSRSGWNGVVNHDQRVVHRVGHWLLVRSEPVGLWIPTRLEYRFGTHAFQNGRQTRFLRYLQHDGMPLPGTVEDRRSTAHRSLPAFHSNLTRRMLQFDAARMPTVAAEASQIASSLGENAQSPYRVADAIEEYLATTGGFEYTLHLTEERDRSVDPIEEFVARTRRGHCQYYASAMVMMLRSQKIPARIVLGYKTDEYNPIGGHYVVRQLHAHAWVEALLDEDQLPLGARLAGQPPGGPVLVRFDPTPGGTGNAPSFSKSDQFYDFAQSLWSLYVLDMSGERQSQEIFSEERDVGFSDAYVSTLSWVKDSMSRLFDGRSTVEGLAQSLRFSWRAALLSIIVALIMVGLYWMGLPHWVWRSWPARSSATRAASVSDVGFYQQLCQLLARLGLHRDAGQTPQEFVDDANLHLESSGIKKEPAAGSGAAGSGAAGSGAAGEAPLRTLVDLFYRVRYGGGSISQRQASEVIEPSLEQVEGLVHRSVQRPLHRDPLGPGAPGAAPSRVPV